MVNVPVELRGSSRTWMTNGYLRLLLRSPVDVRIEFCQVESEPNPDMSEDGQLEGEFQNMGHTHQETWPHPLNENGRHGICGIQLLTGPSRLMVSRIIAIFSYWLTCY